MLTALEYVVLFLVLACTALDAVGRDWLFLAHTRIHLT